MIRANKTDHFYEKGSAPTKFFQNVVGLVLAIVLCAPALAGPPSFAGPPLPHFIDESRLPFDALPGTNTTRLWGVHTGAAYRIEVPENWNGDLVMYAHGFRGTCAPDGTGACELFVDDNIPIRQFLIDNGYAWAASSYSENGYQVGVGVRDTHALATLFNGQVGNPDRTYIMGFSMGGHITGVSVEQYPNAYDGALPMCGVMGDNELFDYFLDANMVATTLAGQEGQISFPLPEGFDYFNGLVPTIKAQLGFVPFFPSPAGQQWTNSVAVLSGGDRPLFEHGWIFWNFFATDFLYTLFGGDSSIGAAPGSVTSNVDAVYQLDFDPAQSAAEADLNDRAPRKDFDPQGRHPNGLSAIPVVQGAPSIPVLSMHTLGDLFVPFSMQQIYKRRAIENGVGDLVVQRAIRDAQHCGFSGPEIATAFADLVNWVENDAVPAGDDVLDPSTVAAPEYGCQFTNPVAGPGRPSNFLFNVLGPTLPLPVPPLPGCP